MRRSQNHQIRKIDIKSMCNDSSRLALPIVTDYSFKYTYIPE